MAASTMATSTMTSAEQLISRSSFDGRESQYQVLPRLTKRPTLNFPILPSPSQLDGNRSPSPRQTTPAASIRSSPQLPTVVASSVEFNTFLTSLATQERRVLELREELQRAEAELSLLKKQWAQHEAGRKKNELRQAERLQPLPNRFRGVTDSHNENALTPAAASRASLESGADRPVCRKSTQRVFSGSRHTRALSLLAPSTAMSQPGQSSAFQDTLLPTVTKTEVHCKQPPLSRSSTISSAEQNMGFGRTYKQLAGRRSMPPPARDVIVSTGKKMASDLREGLWTFFEDMRHATVGKEGIHGTEPRTAGSGKQQRQCQRRAQGKIQARGSVKEESTGEIDKEGMSSISHCGAATPIPKQEKSFWKEFGLETPSNKATPDISSKEKRMSEAVVPLVELDDSWDAWDFSPVVHQQSSTHGIVVGEIAPAGEGLPWPELTKLTPSRVSRKVSDLVKEWKSAGIASAMSPAGLDDQAVASPHI
jgi:Domain of unknown function (DUF4048)